MDIHKPKPVHSWREFLTEIGIVVLGIVIALLAEQTVEAIHRSREASSLRGELREESRQILNDARRCEAESAYEQAWLDHRIEQVRAAVWRRQRIAPREPNAMPSCASPDIPIWRSAKSAGKSGLLSKGEVNAYAEVEYVQTHLDQRRERRAEAFGSVQSFNRQLPVVDGKPDYSVLSRDELKAYLALLTHAASALEDYASWLRILRGAELAVTAGKIDLEEIYASERKANKGDVTRDPI